MKKVIKEFVAALMSLMLIMTETPIRCFIYGERTDLLAVAISEAAESEEIGMAELTGNELVSVAGLKGVYDNIVEVLGKMDDTIENTIEALENFERGNLYIPSSYGLGYLDANGDIQISTSRVTFDEYVQMKFPCRLYLDSGYAGTLCTYNSDKTLATRTNMTNGTNTYIPANTIFRFTIRHNIEYNITDVDDIAKHCYLEGTPAEITIPLLETDDIDNVKTAGIYSAINGPTVHWPSDYRGVMVCIDNANTGFYQIVITNTNEIYSRRYGGGSWNAWTRYAMASEVVDAFIPMYSIGIDSSNYSTRLTNANLAPSGKSFFINSNITNQMITNLPEYGSRGVLITFNGIKNETHGRLQVFANKNNNIWFRVESGSGSTYDYTSWCKLTYDEDIAKVEKAIETGKYDFLRCFHKFCGIGDSLMAGFTSIGGESVSSTTARATGNNWFQYLCSRLNRDGTNLAVGSSTTHNWRYGSQSGYPSTQLADADIEGVDCYFVGLGVNDMVHSDENTIGTSADINANDYTQNADSTYGNLDYILHKLKEYNQYAKVFVFTIPWYGENDPTVINTAIEYVCGVNSNAFCIDLSEIGELTDNEFVQDNYTNGHFNPITYNYFSTVIYDAVNKYIFDNYENFVWIPYEH